MAASLPIPVVRWDDSPHAHAGSGAKPMAQPVLPMERKAASAWGYGARPIKPFSLLPPPRCIAGPSAFAEQQSGPAEARWGCGFAPGSLVLNGDSFIWCTLQFLLREWRLWCDGLGPRLLAEAGGDPVYGQDEAGYGQEGDQSLVHGSLTFNVTTMPGRRATAVPAGSSARSAMEAGRCQSSMREEASTSEQRKMSWLPSLGVYLSGC